MSEEQLSALLAKLKYDADLREKLQGAADLDSIVALAREAGFDFSKVEWIRYHASHASNLSDEELEWSTGGTNPVGNNSGAKICGTLGMINEDYHAPIKDADIIQGEWWKILVPC